MALRAGRRTRLTLQRAQARRFLHCALVVKTWSGTTLLVNDLIWNLDDRPGFGGWLFRVMGFTGREPRIPTIVGLREIKDKSAQLQRWARIPDLNRIIVSHGEIVRRDVAAVLDRLAESLAP